MPNGWTSSLPAVPAFITGKYLGFYPLRRLLLQVMKGAFPYRKSSVEEWGWRTDE